MSEKIFNEAIYLTDIPKSEWKNYIGNGYRNVCYTTDVNRKGQIVFFGYDKENNPKTFICPWQSWIKYCVKYKTDELDVYGRYIATKYFDNASSRKKYLESCDGLIVVEALRPEQEFLQYMFADVVFDDPNFNKQPWRVFTIDIETEISEQFMKPSQADNRVNMITVYDNFTDKYYTWSLEHAEIDFKEEPLCNMPKDKFVLFEFNNNENHLLQHFMDWYEENIPSVIFGWNISGFDCPYLYTRISKQLGKNEANRFSPTGKCFVKEVNHDNKRANVAAEIEISIDGVFQSDGLLLYRDKFKIAGSTLDGGYSLDNVGEFEGLGHKIKYEGTLKDLYVKNWQKFYEYNVRDVDLCKRIDDKCKMTNLARTITGFGLCNCPTIYSSISYLIGSCIAFSKTKMPGKRVFTSYLKDKKDFNEGFEGAFVFPCTSGIYKKGIGCIDFASLYPSIIRALNISHETYVGKVLIHFKNPTGNITCDTMHEAKFNPFCDDDSVWGEDDVGNRIRLTVNAGDKDIDHLELKLPGEKDSRKPITLEQLRTLINTKCVWTPNNTLFLKHEVKQGVVAKWCEFFYGLRKQNKKKELKIFHTLHNEEDVSKMNKEQIREAETQEEVFHSIQMALKIMINSIYGCTGTSFSPIADPNIAQTITRMGRFCNMSTAEFIKKSFIEKFNADPNYVANPSGDTDSLIFSSKIRVKY